jgi:hypothetical protein
MICRGAGSTVCAPALALASSASAQLQRHPVRSFRDFHDFRELRELRGCRGVRGFRGVRNAHDARDATDVRPLILFTPCVVDRAAAARGRMPDRCGARNPGQFASVRATIS